MEEAEAEPKPKSVWRVLIVDDDPHIPSLVRRILTYHLKDKVIVEVERRGPDGLGKVDASLDILITDYQMPGMDGPELIRLAREIAPDLKVVLMSGDDGGPERLAAAKSSSILTLDKPFDARTLMELMAKLMT